ncbi:MAG TPA: hypothetical protein VGB73_01855 [Pyrinomonadaceae bacterium]|jgi:hypothetical protein
MPTNKMFPLKIKLIAMGGILVFATLASANHWVHASRHTGGTRQGDVKLFEKGDDFNPPVKITLVKSKIGVIATDKKIDTDDDWLKGLTIRVRNDSGKVVTHVSVELRFRRPQNQATERDLVVPLSYGSDPFDSRALSPSSPPAFVLPGQTIDVSVSDTKYESIRSMLNDLNYPPSIKAVRARIRAIGFEDGTAWASGTIFERDPNNPGEWLPQKKAKPRRS